MNPPRIKVAVVGLGVGRLHLEALAALPHRYALQALCDVNPLRLQALAAQYPAPLLTARYEDVLADNALDLVVLCTPPHLHRAQILQALAAGKHVVCEKPLVTSLAELDEVQAAQAISGRRVFPVFQVRWGQGLHQLKHLQAQGLARHALLVTVETHWRREADYYATAWRGRWATECGGVCLTQAIHAHDLLAHVLGPVHQVFAQLATRVNDIEVEDCAAVVLTLANGALATLSATLGAVRNQTRLKWMFHDLSVLSDSANPYRPAQAPWHFQGRTATVDAAIAEALASCPPLAEGFVGQWQAVHAQLGGEAATRADPAGAALLPTLADARAALALVTATYHAAETGTAVTLPITPEHPKYAGWTPLAGQFPKALPG